MVKKYMKKPVIIEAVQWTGDNFGEVALFCDRISEAIPQEDELIIKTLEGNIIASKGDYIIKGVQGEFYPCKPDVFHKKYEEVESY